MMSFLCRVYAWTWVLENSLVIYILIYAHKLFIFGMIICRIRLQGAVLLSSIFLSALCFSSPIWPIEHFFSTCELIVFYLFINKIFMLTTWLSDRMHAQHMQKSVFHPQHRDILKKLKHLLFYVFPPQLVFAICVRESKFTFG